MDSSLRFWTVVSGLLLAGCSTTSSGVEAMDGAAGDGAAVDSVDVGRDCVSDTDCTGHNEGCFFAIDGGCNAQGTCQQRPVDFGGTGPQNCAALIICGCDGGEVRVCDAPHYTSPQPTTGGFPGPLTDGGFGCNE